ncbi:MAG: hypothetical protein INQ03_15495 [Candidatus Heimdallarchaeota archaeon]|nr:hypothetical protein [Candidatus Heimdallarchaeota archaeon]
MKNSFVALLVFNITFILFIWQSKLQRSSVLFLRLYPLVFIAYILMIYLMEKNKGNFMLNRTIWFIIVLVRVLILFVPTGLSDDIYRYVWDARVQAAGINPYLFSPESTEISHLRENWFYLINNPDIPTPYPPVSQLLFFIVLAPVSNINHAILIFRIFITICDLASIYILSRILELFNKPKHYVVYYAFSPLALIEFAGNGHNDAIAVLFLLLTLYYHFNKHGSYTYKIPLFLALAIMTKMYPIFLIPLVMPFWRRREYVIFIITILVTSLPYLNNGIVPFFSPGQQIFLRYFEFNSSLFRVLHYFIENPLLVRYLITAFVGLSYLFLLTLYYRNNQTSEALLSILLHILLLSILLSPNVHPWYILWLLPIAVILRNWTGLILSLLIVFSYEIYIQYDNHGIWEEKIPVLLLEYIPVYIIFILEAFMMVRKLKKGIYRDGIILQRKD